MSVGEPDAASCAAHKERRTFQAVHPTHHHRYIKAAVRRHRKPINKCSLQGQCTSRCARLSLSAISALACAQRQLFAPTDVAVGNDSVSSSSRNIHNHTINIRTIYSEIKTIPALTTPCTLMIRIPPWILNASTTETVPALHYCGGASWLLFIHMERYNERKYSTLQNK